MEGLLLVITEHNQYVRRAALESLSNLGNALLVGLMSLLADLWLQLLGRLNCGLCEVPSPKTIRAIFRLLSPAGDVHLYKIFWHYNRYACGSEILSAIIP